MRYRFVYVFYGSEVINFNERSTISKCIVVHIVHRIQITIDFFVIEKNI